MNNNTFYLLLVDIYSELKQNVTLSTEKVKLFSNLMKDSEDVIYDEDYIGDALVLYVTKFIKNLEINKKDLLKCLSKILDNVIVVFPNLNKDLHILLFEFYLIEDVSNLDLDEKIKKVEAIINVSTSNIFIASEAYLNLLGWYSLNPSKYFDKMQDIASKLKIINPLLANKYKEATIYSSIYGL